MTLHSRPLPDGQMFMMSDQLMLVDDVQAITVLGFQLGKTEVQPQVHLTLQGRTNKSTDRSDITVALNREGITAVFDVLLHNLAALNLAEEEESEK